MKAHITHCQLHGVGLVDGEANITYGLPRPTEDYQRACKYLFPMSRLTVVGGCMYDSQSPKTQKVMYCPICRQTEEKWTPSDWSF